jgi:uncharacterized protein YndB with AHSA1/START domain
MSDSIRREITFSQPPEDVWQALTDSAVLAEWLMPNDFEPRVGHRFTFRTQPNPQANFDGIVRCEVLECEPPRQLAYSWAGGGVDTRVTYRLEPDGGGTRMLFEQSGFEHPQALQGAEYGWTHMLEQLGKILSAGR